MERIEYEAPSPHRRIFIPILLGAGGRAERTERHAKEPFLIVFYWQT